MRTKRVFTHDDLERKSGLKHTTLTKIESNVFIKPSVQTVDKITKALGVLMEDWVKYSFEYGYYQKI